MADHTYDSSPHKVCKPRKGGNERMAPNAATPSARVNTGNSSPFLSSLASLSLSLSWIPIITLISINHLHLSLPTLRWRTSDVSSANANAQVRSTTEAPISSGAVPPQGTGAIMSKESGVPESKSTVKPAPRLYHKKSRTGCQQCRARRVKVHPHFVLILSQSISSHRLY